MKFLQTISLFVFVFITFNFVSSQQIPTNLTSTCLTELIIKLSGNSELNNCASFTKLAQLQNTTDPKPILDSYCSAPKCNDNTTSTAATELKSQCATDLAAKDPIVTAVKNILVFNSPLKDSLCFKNSSGGYCDLDPNSKDILGYIGGMNATPPTDINCNDCNKAILNTFVNYFKQHPESTTELSTDSTSFENLVSTKCGASFLNGTVPTPTSSSTSTSTGADAGATGAKSGGISMHSPSFIGFTMFANTIIVASFIILITYAI
ncbi:hypothetical protein C2G38_1041804 [Gigaspora rosea]|uniref:DUF7729 domain-containing protein n=1 Tax=Gigaspora rosea TaxID=44941 RepID=A0A397W4K5_9GLOM|nr:hypothetical protein C2G38_1041804 [Gigaspora rosea]